MYLRRSANAALAVMSLTLVVAGCGSSSKKASQPTGGGGAATPAAEAKAKATGDIPDNQVFLTYRDPSGGYSIVYPEGWAQRKVGTTTTFQDKANVIRVVVQPGPKPTVANVKAGVEKLKSSSPALTVTSAATLTIGGQPVAKVSYSSESSPDPVTGKRVKLIVDRYAYFKGGRVAIVDLGTAVGVDNVDAYKMIARSFKWK